MARLIGALLIGGASRRMGRPKSLLPLKGTTCGAYLCGLLREVCGREPLLVGTGSIGDATEAYGRVTDRQAGAGPLSALLGLYDQWGGGATDFLVLATDLVAMNAAALNWLLDQVPGDPRLATWPRLPGRPFGEPLAAFYRAAAAPSLEEAWCRGERSLKRALPASRLYQPEIPPTHRAAFANANRPADLLGIQDRALDAPRS